MPIKGKMTNKMIMIKLSTSQEARWRLNKSKNNDNKSNMYEKMKL